MISSIKYVLNQHISNIYRIFSITRYDRLSSNRESKLGFLWEILSPLIQIGTYWFVFGLGLRGGQPVNGVSYLCWMLAGLVPWFFLSACLRNTTNSILSKINVLEKMSFPTSILITTTVLNEFITHIIMIIILQLLLLFQNIKLPLINIQLIYYIFCGFFFSISFGLVFSVLTMLVRDTKKLINSTMRMLFYVTPILWTTENLSPLMNWIMKLNPLSYIIEGYRVSLFSQFTESEPQVTLAFWLITLSLFCLGCSLIYKNRRKFIDLA